MARHAVEPVEKIPVKLKQRLYDDIFQSIMGLKEQAMKWWKTSLDSKIVCNGCLDETPRKKNKAGACAYCDGSGYVADKEQRNMAFKEVIARLSPAPKAVEMKIDDNRDKEELMKKYEGMPKEEVEKLLAQMAISVSGTAEMIPAAEPTDGNEKVDVE